MTQTTNPESLRALTDVHDMVVVHRVFRRELLLIPALVRDVAPADTARAALVARHIRLVLGGLHVHHSGEDALLWPLLLERAEPSTELVRRMQAQHHHVEEILGQLTPALDRWEVEARPAVTEEVATTVESLHGALLEHLDTEEASILPLAARHVTQAEWNQIGQHGLAEMSKAQLPLLFGMILEDATPAERTAMLATVPAPVRLLVRTVFARRYRRYVSSIRTA